MIPVRRNQYWLPSIFNDIFDDEFIRPDMAKVNSTIPAVNIIENEKDFTIELAAPGMSKNDFKISIAHNDELTIEMEKKEEKKEGEDNKKAGKFLRREFSYSRSQKSFTLPESVDKNGISAKMENGVLTIVLPKIDEEKKNELSRTIDIL